MLNRCTGRVLSCAFGLTMIAAAADRAIGHESAAVADNRSSSQTRARAAASREQPQGATPPVVGFARQPGKLQITIDQQQFATYVYQDEQVLRPYFCNVKSPGGRQATRHHPPRPDQDSVDHPTMHPGIWLAFGDISGHDFWRNRARVEHVRFEQQPQAEPNRGSFTVKNRYVAGRQTVCTETCRHTVLRLPAGYLLIYDSTFQTIDDRPFTFGDQEEFGLGVRVAAQMRVRGGTGRILNSDGLKNEPQVWGKPADWCEYSGLIGNQRVGLLLVPSPKNFRPSWFHARDYGLLVANPFGRKALSRGETSSVTVNAGKSLRLRFGVLVYSHAQESAFDLKSAYRDCLKQMEKPQ